RHLRFAGYKRGDQPLGERAMATSTYAPSATTTAFAEMTAPHREHNMSYGSMEARCNLKQINVGDWERWFSLAAGSGLALYGLTRGSFGGLGLALAGAALTVRGVTGHCHVYEALGINTAESHGAQASIAAGHGVKIERSITVERPRREVFRFWRDFSNLP